MYPSSCNHFTLTVLFNTKNCKAINNLLCLTWQIKKANVYTCKTRNRFDGFKGRGLILCSLV